MKYQKEAHLIDELVLIAQNIQHPFEGGITYKSFGLEEYNISFIGSENCSKYEEILEKLFALNKEIYSTYTIKDVENALINLIRKLKNNNIKCNAKDLNSLIEELLKQKVDDYEILYDFYGAKLDSDSTQFGDFTIYNKEKSFNFLSATYPHLKNKELFLDSLKSELLIGIKVKARENLKAVEIADKLCQSFENVFNYALADLTHERRIGILSFRGWTSISKIVCNNNSMGHQGKNDFFFPVNLDDPFFKDPKQGNDKIWGLITKSHKTEIETRLLNAMEWIGKASYDRDMPKSLVQFVFAIEGMLQLNEKAFITPSIVSQLSDWLAFIIQDDKDKRINISKYFKDIYQKRSAIAHGANKTINFDDLQMARQISKLMVITFLTINPFNEMTSMEQLNNYLTELKFK